MVDKDGKDPEAPSGLLGKLWGPRKKHVKAHLGDKNTMFYDDKLKIWRKHGEEPPVGVGVQGPPPMSSTANSQPQNERPNTGSRYASANAFGQSAPSNTAPSFLPSSSKNNSQQAPFLPKPSQNTGGQNKPNFFRPAGPTQASSSSTNFPWGGNQQASSAPVFSPRDGGKGNPSSPTQNVRNDLQSPPTPPSAKSNTSQEQGRSGWASWRKQDQENREKERMLAQELGADIMESLDEGDLEAIGQDPSQMNITASFNDLEDQSAMEDGQEGVEHSNDSSLTLNGWQGNESHGSSATSPLRAPFPPHTSNSLSPRGNFQTDFPQQNSDTAFGSYGDQDPYAADDYFGGTDEAQELDADPMLKSDTLESGQDFFNDDKQPEIEAGSGMTVEHESNDQNYQIQEGNDQNYEAPGEPTWAGGYTQAMIQQWVNYYEESQEMSPEEIQNWAQSLYAQPDPPGAYQEYPMQEEAQNFDLVVSDPQDMENSDDIQGESPNVQTESAQPDNTLNGETELEQDPNEQSDKAQSGEPQASQFSNVDQAEIPEIAHQTTFKSDATGSFQKQHSEQPGLSMTKIQSLDHLKEMLNEQKRKAKDPGFGKLKGPLPWDGVISDNDETPNTSPKAFLNPSSKRSKGSSRLGKKNPDLKSRSQSAPVVDLELQAHLAQLPKNELGATWLDKFGEKILTIDFKKQKQRRKSALLELEQVKEEPKDNGPPGPILPSIKVASQSPNQSPKSFKSSPQIQSASPENTILKDQKDREIVGNGLHVSNGIIVKTEEGCELESRLSNKSSASSNSQPTPTLTPRKSPSKLEAENPTNQTNSLLHEKGQGSPQNGHSTSQGLSSSSPQSSSPQAVDNLGQAVTIKEEFMGESEGPNENSMEEHELDSRIKELQNQLDEKSAECQSLLTKCQDQEMLFERIEAFESEEANLKRQAEEAESIKTQFDALKAEKKALEEEIKGIKRSLSEKEKLTNESLRAGDENSSETGQESVSAQIHSLEERLKDLEAQNQDLKAQLESRHSQDEYEKAVKNGEIHRQKLESMQENAKLATENQERLSNDLQKVVDELDLSKRRQNELERDLKATKEFQREFEAAKTELQGSKEEVENLRAQTEILSKQSAEIESLKQQVVSLESLLKEIEELKEGKDKDSTELAQLSNELEELQQNYMDLEDQFEERQSKVNALEKTREELSAKNLEYETLEAEVESLKAQIEGIESNNSGLNGRSDLSEKLKALETENASWQAKMRKAKISYNNVSKQKKEAQDRIKALEEEISQLKNVQPDSSINETLKSQCEEFKEHILSLEEERTQLQNQLGEFKSQIENLQESLKTCEGQISELNQEKERIENQVQESSQYNQNLEQEIDDWKEKYRLLNEQFEANQKDLNDAKDLNESSNEARLLIQEQLDTTQKELENTETRLEASVEKQNLAESNAAKSAESLLQMQESQMKLEDEILKLESEVGEAREDKRKAQNSVNEQKELTSKAEKEVKFLTEKISELEHYRSTQPEEASSKDAEIAKLEGEKGELETELEDMLVFSGQDEEKIQRLSDKLTEFGFDVAAFLQQIEDEFLDQQIQPVIDSNEKEESETETLSQIPQENLGDAESVTSAYPILAPSSPKISQDYQPQVSVNEGNELEKSVRFSENVSSTPQHNDAEVYLEDNDDSQADFFNDGPTNQNGWGSEDIDFFSEEPVPSFSTETAQLDSQASNHPQEISQETNPEDQSGHNLSAGPDTEQKAYPGIPQNQANKSTSPGTQPNLVQSQPADSLSHRFVSTDYLDDDIDYWNDDGGESQPVEKSGEDLDWLEGPIGDGDWGS